jgi:hypothetical protein
MRGIEVKRHARCSRRVILLGSDWRIKFIHESASLEKGSRRLRLDRANPTASPFHCVQVERFPLHVQSTPFASLSYYILP